MTLTIELSEPAKRELTARAAKAGLTVEELTVKYIIQELDYLEACDLSNTKPDAIVEYTQSQQG